MTLERKYSLVLEALLEISNYPCGLDNECAPCRAKEVLQELYDQQAKDETASERPLQTLAFCKHGTPGKYGCYICTVEFNGFDPHPKIVKL
jgi:hypothetical protein